MDSNNPTARDGVAPARNGNVPTASALLGFQQNKRDSVGSAIKPTKTNDFAQFETEMENVDDVHKEMAKTSFI